MSITAQIDRLDQSLSDVGFERSHTVHTGALIRNEEEYRGLPVELRKAVFTRIYAFSVKAPISYTSFCLRRREHPEPQTLIAALSRALAEFLRENATYFLSFDRVVVYYDNGQHQITEVLNTVLNSFFFRPQFKNVQPAQYRLFQTADFFCALELLRAKSADNALSRSDLYFFRTTQRLRKDYLRKIETRRFPRRPPMP
ncbi:MAG: hypothetical protein QM621_11990 [Aeromicrobium sp.]|uniref:hypothetical protein n=1 Tax=Aeromicrobium sp. TaxID=1871063 RepID=UPI0039E4DA91